MTDQTQRPTLWRLADVLLGGKLEPFVRERRAAGKPWRTIERELWLATEGQADVTAQTLKTWFPDEPAAEPNGAVA